MTEAKNVVEQRMAEIERREQEEQSLAVRKAATEWLMMFVGRKADELPPGVRGDTEECVFAHALGGSFSGVTWAPGANSSPAMQAVAARIGIDSIQLPPVVREFISRFDAGEYPDLEQYRDTDCD